MMANLKQRPLKFRAWQSFEKKMYQNVQDAYDYCNFSGNDDAIPATYFGAMLIDGTEWTVMQFTGLKDKNGVDIYEGDILSNGVASGVMEWVELNHTNAWSMFAPKGSFEVIGNIFENPELLKDK